MARKSVGMRGHLVFASVRAENGTTTVVVAIALLLLFGAGAIAIDLGSAWETKRGLVVDTDAAALAGAHVLSQPGGNCVSAEMAAAEHLSANLGETITVAELHLDAGAALICDPVNERVTVAWTGEATKTVSDAISGGDLDVYSSSTAHVVETPIGGGLRPFSVCMTDPAISAWVAGGAGSTHRLDITKVWKNAASENCQGGAPGNWGYVCYTKHKHNAGSCSATSLAELVLNGYAGTVDLQTSNPADGDCDPETLMLDECDAITGSINASHFKAALDTIKCDTVTTPDVDDCAYQFPILGIHSFTGRGSTAEIHPTHFVGVVLRAWHITGSSGYLDFELVNLFDSGTSAVVDDGTPTVTRVALCGADAVGDHCD